MTRYRDLPHSMKVEHRGVPDWAANVSFADAMVWLANRLDAGTPERITVEWLRIEASRTYDMAREQWEEEGLYAREEGGDDAEQ